MSITYGIIEESHEVGGKKRISYGIAAYSDVKESGSATVLCRVNDLSPCRENVLRAVDLLNQSGASLLHFEDLIDDYLAQN